MELVLSVLLPRPRFDLQAASVHQRVSKSMSLKLQAAHLSNKQESPNMSAEVRLERQKKADLRAAPAFAPRVPTVTLISHRELRDKYPAHILQPERLDHNLAASSHYRACHLTGPVL